MDFQKTVVLFSNPQGYRDAIESYLKYFDAKITVDKSVGGIVAFHSLAVVGLTIAQFFQGAPTVNNTNQQSFTRPESEHFIIMYMKSLEGASAVLQNTVWARGLNDLNTQNGDFTFTNNGVVELNRIPNTVFTQAAENPFSGIYELPLPIVWKGQTQINIRAEYRTAVAAANWNQRYELFGLGYLS